MVLVLLLGFCLLAALAYIIRVINQRDELKDLIIWYRKSLAERDVGWQEVERGRLVAYALQPELRPGGAYRTDEGIKDMTFVTADEARAPIKRFDAWWERVRGRHHT